MKLPRLRQVLLLILVIGLLSGFGYVVIRSGPLAATRVTVASPERRDLQPALFGIGTVEARRAYAIGPTAAGRVQQVLVNVGDTVAAGQLVAEMEPVDLDDRIAAAQAALRRAGNAWTAAEAQVRETESRRALADDNARRFTELRRQGFVTQEAVDTRQYEANAARTALAAAQANRDAGQDRERLLAEQTAATKLRANGQLHSPVAGVVIARDAEPGSTVVAGQSVLRLMDPTSLWLKVRIDQGRSAGLQAGLPADIELRSRPGERFPGRVARVELAGDSVTEEKIAQVAFDALPDGVALGELAEVTVRLPAIPNAPVLPNPAIQQKQGQTGVWLLTEDGTARFQPLRFGIRDLDGAAQILDSLPPEARIIVHSSRELREGDAVKPSEKLAGGARMISLAGRDILHSWGKYAFTGLGLGLLIGVTLSMAGIYRGMVDDGKALLANSGADLWVVQRDSLGPYAEPSSLRDDAYRGLLGLPGVARAANVTYLTMQARQGERDVRVMVVGIQPGEPGEPRYLIAGRQIERTHYEAVADASTGFQLGERVRIRRHDYTVVGLTRRMVSASGDPMVFIPLRDAQEAQFLKDNDALINERARVLANPALNRPGMPGLAETVSRSQETSRMVNAVLVQTAPGWAADEVAETIRRWKRLQAYTVPQMEEILVAKLIATSARQIGVFLVILAVVSAAIVSFIIYTMTLGKLREIAVLKLIGARNRTIAGMILQEALGLGLIGFVVGKTVATLWAPYFPKYVLLEPGDAARGFVAVMLICALASTLAIRTALQVDPATAIGG